MILKNDEPIDISGPTIRRFVVDSEAMADTMAEV
jgi:hypothetical protein